VGGCHALGESTGRCRRPAGTVLAGAGIICVVTEESTTPFDAAPSVCPFLAFEDDRDHRSDSPDYRHRCFAAPEPEPRAFPHQERYCLSDDFARCPVFMDWARQEAAGVKARGTDHATTLDSALAEVGADGEPTPAFLASRPRTASIAGAGPSSKKATDASATLWTYEGENRRTAPSAPTPPSSLGVPAVAMARRGPSHPGWENPPRLESFPLSVWQADLAVGGGEFNCVRKEVVQHLLEAGRVGHGAESGLSEELFFPLQMGGAGREQEKSE